MKPKKSYTSNSARSWLPKLKEQYAALASLVSKNYEDLLRRIHILSDHKDEHAKLINDLHIKADNAHVRINDWAKGRDDIELKLAHALRSIDDHRKYIVQTSADQGKTFARYQNEINDLKQTIAVMSLAIDKLRNQSTKPDYESIKHFVQEWCKHEWSLLQPQVSPTPDHKVMHDIAKEVAGNQAEKFGQTISRSIDQVRQEFHQSIVALEIRVNSSIFKSAQGIFISTPDKVVVETIAKEIFNCEWKKLTVNRQQELLESKERQELKTEYQGETTCAPPDQQRAKASAGSHLASDNQGESFAKVLRDTLNKAEEQILMALSRRES
jgi:flagellar hook-basal body complex protein FliE